MDLTSSNTTNDVKGHILNEGILPVELQTPNIVPPSYRAIVSPNISDGHFQGIEGLNESTGDPYLTIVEQPQQRGFRFRYECEGPSHGGLQGTKSERGRKSYPAIKIENYTGAARVLVTLVTDEKNPRCHAHKLVGTNCKNGQGKMEIPANSGPISFPNLCILHVTRKKLVDVLSDRILDTIKLEKKLKVNDINHEPDITDEDRQLSRNQAKEQSKNMQLNVVRLCFQVFLRNPDGSFDKMLTPVVSQPIYDSKSPGASALKICRMDKYGGCCSGNEEVFLLCEKVQKDDIMVKFVEQGQDEKVKWEAYANFGPLDVHRQYAIVFKTPKYWNANIEKAVNVFIMLQRRSDSEVSEPIAFTYFPQNRDKDNIASKKRKRIPLDGYGFGGDGGGGFGGGGDFGGDSGGGSGDGIDMDGGGGGGSQIPSQYILMQNGDITQQRNSLPLSSLQGNQNDIILPEPVEEVMKEINKPNPANCPASSHMETANLNTDRENVWYTNSHPAFLIQVDGDSNPQPSCQIEVDGDSTQASPSYPGYSSALEPSPSSLPNSPTRRTHIPLSSHLESDEAFYSRDTRKDKSLDWLDSGVDTLSHKSFSSIDDRKDKRDLSMADRLSTSSSSSGSRSRTTRSDMGDKKVSKSSTISESNSQNGNLKKDAFTVKSDEGFSETSEGAALRLKSSIVKKEKVEREHQTSQTTHSSKENDTASNVLADTFKRVTGNIADRTISALRDYAETGDILHLLLVQRHLMAISNVNGDLPLHLGIINAQAESVKNLVQIMGTLPQLKVYINSVNLLRQSPLHLATIMGQGQVVERLLHAGADPTQADRNGNTSAHLAVINQRETCLASLVKYVRPDTDRLNPFPELNYLNYEGYSPVHLAAMKGSVSMLRRLVFGKADLDLPDGKCGKTSLHHAVDNNDLDVANYLLSDNSCDVNARCFDGNTALHIACARQRVGMAALLVSSGADVDIENEEIPDLLAVGEDGMKRNRRGHTPFDYADGNEKILSILYKDYEESLSVTLQHQMAGVSLNESISCDGSHYSYGKENDLSGKDLQSLSLSSRIKLSQMLDTSQSDITELAVKLNYSSLSNILLDSVKKTGLSAATFLLEFLESQHSSLATLEEGLTAIGRKDVVDFLHQATSQ